MKAADGKAIAEDLRERYASACAVVDAGRNIEYAGLPIALITYKWALSSKELIERLSAAEERERVLREALNKALAANERDRTALHRTVSAIDEEITGRMWLMEGRGCYEWDDDRYRLEFGWAIGAIRKNIEVLRKIAGDLSNCPTTQKDVDAAHAALATPAPEPSEQNGGQ